MLDGLRFDWAHSKYRRGDAGIGRLFRASPTSLQSRATRGLLYVRRGYRRQRARRSTYLTNNPRPIRASPSVRGSGGGHWWSRREGTLTIRGVHASAPDDQRRASSDGCAFGMGFFWTKMAWAGWRSWAACRIRLIRTRSILRASCISYRASCTSGHRHRLHLRVAGSPSTGQITIRWALLTLNMFSTTTCAASSPRSSPGNLTRSPPAPLASPLNRLG